MSKILSKEELKSAFKEAMQETLAMYGFTVGDPNEMQNDMLHLRKLRLGCEATKRNIMKAFVTVTVPASLYIIWEALKGAMK